MWWQVLVMVSNGEGMHVAQMVCTALMMEGSFGLGMVKMEPLPDKHEDMNCVCLETGMSERDSVLPTQENSFNSNSRTYKRQFRSES